MTPQQESQLKQEARKRGYSPDKIEQFVQFAKQKESAPKQVVEQSPQKAQGSSFMERLKQGFSSGVNKVKSGFEQLKSNKDASILQRPINVIEGVGKIGSGAIQSVFSPATAAAEPVIKPTVGAALNYATDKISNNPTVQRFANSKAGEITSRVTEDVSNYNDIVGAFVGPKAVPKVTKPLTTAVTRVADSAAGLVDDVSRIGREATDSLVSTIDEPTKTVLNPTRNIPAENLGKLSPKRLVQEADDTQALYDRYLKQAQKSSTDMSKPSALDLAGSRADEALKALQDKLSRAGELKTTALKTTGQNVVKGVSEARQTLQRLAQERLGVRITKDGVKDALGRISKVDSTDHALLQRFDDALAKLGDNPTVQQVDDIVDQVQDVLYRTRTNTAIQVNEKTASVLKDVLGELNKRAKLLGGTTYRKANSRYANMIDTFEKLNKALGLDASKGGSLMKRVFSPTDGGTKKLFADVKRITGIDLTKEATLAKLAMDTVGDPRSRNLLEQLELLKPTGALGWLERGAKYVIDKAKDPEREARQLIEQGKRIKP
jgi:ABC-type transporter Mla MlaB component